MISLFVWIWKAKWEVPWGTTKMTRMKSWQDIDLESLLSNLSSMFLGKKYLFLDNEISLSVWIWKALYIYIYIWWMWYWNDVTLYMNTIREYLWVYVYFFSLNILWIAAMYLWRVGFYFKRWKFRDIKVIRIHTWW